MTKLSEEQLKLAIDGLDLSMIVNKMISDQGWTCKDAEKACQLYRNFLFLSAKYPEKRLPPSEDVDEVWHNHVLATKKYMAECDAIFGKYMHHYPYFGIDKKTDLTDLGNAFMETQRLHKEEFGEYIYEIRGWGKKLASCLRMLCKVEGRPARPNI